MYTNGTLATEENLKALGEAGLDELRFNLGASNASDKVIEAIATAKKYIRYVGIETPMTPEYFEAFMQKKDNDSGNRRGFHELCGAASEQQQHLELRRGKNMYAYRQGYISPIWSRELTFKLMKLADEEGWECCGA